MLWDATLWTQDMGRYVGIAFLFTRHKGLPIALQDPPASSFLLSRERAHRSPGASEAALFFYPHLLVAAACCSVAGRAVGPAPWRKKDRTFLRSDSPPPTGLQDQRWFEGRRAPPRLSKWTSHSYKPALRGHCKPAL